MTANQLNQTPSPGLADQQMAGVADGGLGLPGHSWSDFFFGEITLWLFNIAMENPL